MYLWCTLAIWKYLKPCLARTHLSRETSFNAHVRIIYMYTNLCWHKITFTCHVHVPSATYFHQQQSLVSLEAFWLPKIDTQNAHTCVCIYHKLTDSLCSFWKGYSDNNYIQFWLKSVLYTYLRSNIVGWSRSSCWLWRRNWSILFRNIICTKITYSTCTCVIVSTV